ncbi:MAG: beta-N-acetylhexosaminidase [Propionibacteriales bacterium]|nr:beta-N-acetylhexosaminidase [Propionibacteriales bacterium]
MTDPLIRRLVSGTLLVGFAGTTAPDWLRRWVADGLAGVCLFARNHESPEQLAALTGAMRAESPELLVAIDEEGGQVTRLEARGGSTLPGQAALGHLDEPETTRRVARVCADRLRALGIDVALAPVADVNIAPENPVIGARAFGDDPALVARHVAAYVSGLRDGGVAACVKHFPGHGDTRVDSHVGVPVVDHDRSRWEAVDLPPFRAAFAARAPLVMTAHVVVPALDRQIATLSPAVLTGVLRRDLGFAGVAVSDALEMAAVSETVGVGEGAVQAMRAGADLLCTGLREEPGYAAAAGLEQAVASGRLPVARLEEAVARVGEVATWTRRARRAGAPAPVDVDLYDVVRRAAVVHDPGTRLPLSAPALVLEISAPVSTGVGGTGADLAAALRGSLPDAERAPVDGDAGLLEDRLSKQSGPVVLTVRDLVTGEDSRRCVRRALELRPDAVVVLTGLLADARLLPAGTTYVAVHAAGAVHVEVAADILAGR